MTILKSLTVGLALSIAGLGTATADTPYETQRDLCNAAIIDAVAPAAEEIRLRARYRTIGNRADIFSYTMNFDGGWGIAKCVISDGRVQQVELPRAYIRHLERTNPAQFAEFRPQD
ncbi:MAG: hypothetical protein AAFY34_12980 [Pseudomonadota bacterium]